MTTFITIIYVIVALVMVLSILLQAGKGGGLGSALGGGASQGVFGGGGGADFMSKLTQGFAATFMICAMYLAYASAHVGSEFLEGEDQGSEGLLEPDAEINYERLGPRAQPLPTAEEGKAMQANATALVPAQSDAPPEMIEEATTREPVEDTPEDATGPAADEAGEQAGEQAGDEAGEDASATDEAVNGARGESPEDDRGESPHNGDESPPQTPPDNKNPSDDTPADGSEDDQAG